MDGKDIGIGFFIFFFQETLGGILTKAARIDPVHVYGGLALDNPFCQLPACPACGCDAKTMPFIQPEIRQVPCRANNRAAIRGIGNRPVIDFFYANFAKGRYTGNGRFNMGHQPFQIFLKQLIFAILIRAIKIADRCAFFIWPQNQAAIFLAHIPRAVTFTQNAHFRQAFGLTLANSGMRLGYDILMLDRNNRNIQTHHRPGAAGKISGGRDHMITPNLALVGCHQPFPGSGARNSGYHCITINFSAPFARALGQRLG